MSLIAAHVGEEVVVVGVTVLPKEILPPPRSPTDGVSHGLLQVRD